MAGTGRAMGSHQRANRGATDTWLTPPEMVEALGPFDLDPCCPEVMPWRTARVMVKQPNDGLAVHWWGTVWLNPPYGPETGKWLERLANHGDGIALVFARTETEMFHRWVWQEADTLLFLKGRLHFHRPDGTRAKANAGAPSVLIGYGWEAFERLRTCGIPGRFVPLDNHER